MKIDGGCHCGAIRFEAEVAADRITICHCTDCQNLTGTAYRATVAAPGESFTLQGAPTIYVKTGTSGAKREHAFCPTCGAPIYSTGPETHAVYSLRIGTIRQRHDLGRPRGQGWSRSALAWSADLTGIPKHPTQPQY
ncbi:MAG: GFA family protein [Alphaproteobacteria bacterium]|nr:GFA family protein [Alphaproteobacteria bacterium]